MTPGEYHFIVEHEAARCRANGRYGTNSIFERVAVGSAGVASGSRTFLACLAVGLLSGACWSEDYALGSAVGLDAGSDVLGTILQREPGWAACVRVFLASKQ